MPDDSLLFDKLGKAIGISGGEYESGTAIAVSPSLLSGTLEFAKSSRALMSITSEESDLADTLLVRRCGADAELTPNPESADCE